MKKFFYLLLLAMCVNVPFASARRNVSQAKADGGKRIKKMPCAEWKSTKDLIRSHGIGESMDQQIAMEKGRSNALLDLSSKISISVAGLIDNYANSKEVDKKEELENKYERISKQLVDGVVAGYRTICEEYIVSKKSDGSQVYKCYYALELDKEDAARSAYKKLSKEESIRLDYDYEKFKEELEEQLLKNDKNR